MKKIFLKITAVKYKSIHTLACGAALMTDSKLLTEAAAAAAFIFLFNWPVSLELLHVRPSRPNVNFLELFRAGPSAILTTAQVAHLRQGL